MDAIGRLVRDGSAVGTAFVVTSDGLAATAHHLLAGHPESRWAFEPLTVPEMSLPAEVTEFVNADADVALLRVPGITDCAPIPLASHTGATPGDLVHLRGFAGTREHDSGVGQYVGEVADRGRSWVKVSCRHAQRGMSGAPVILTGTGCAIGVVSARLNAARWNRDTALLARCEDVVALAPQRLRLATATHRFVAGTLRLCWVEEQRTELILETDDFTVSMGRGSANRVYLPDHRDSRFHGQLALAGTALIYQHLGTHTAFLTGATRQLSLRRGDSCAIADKDRLQFASGTVRVEFSAPDLYDPEAGPTSTDEEKAAGNAAGW